MSGTKAGIVIQDRDRQLLIELASMRIIDRELAKLVVGFGSTTRANARLLKLTRSGLLNRFFVGTISAGRKAVYTLSKKGAALVDAPRRGISRSHGKTVVGDLFVAHQMYVNEVYIALKFRSLPDGVRFVSWQAFNGSLSSTTRLIPDGYFEIASREGVRASFLEIDLGHESLKVLDQKIRSYIQFAVSGEFARTFRQQTFRVIVLANSQRRLRSIRAVAAKHTDKLFWFGDLESINRAGLWAPVWLRPKGDQTVRLT